MARHNCPGDDCPVCQARIDEREHPCPDENDWQAGQDAYERWLWRES